eukprot:SM000203S06126  [mRNA]  locus=s203:21270:21837:- [translate_table: standard]
MSCGARHCRRRPGWRLLAVAVAVDLLAAATCQVPARHFEDYFLNLKPSAVRWLSYIAFNAAAGPYFVQRVMREGWSLGNILREVVVTPHDWASAATEARSLARGAAISLASFLLKAPLIVACIYMLVIVCFGLPKTVAKVWDTAQRLPLP